ncbi:MAG: TonB family protein [Betaproteobacteria bacterium]|nr:TonB family protein [Betaproteobacteria bacterium]
MLVCFVVFGMTSACTPSHDATLVNAPIDRPKTLEDKPSAPQPITCSDATDAEEMLRKIEGEIAEKTLVYREYPRRKQIGVRTQDHRFAQYLEVWRAKLERIGELNYPDAARGKIYGSLVMTVSIKHDGSLEKVVIVRPSRHPILNEAAEKIVRLGEPYDPFPPEITHDTDILEITRTWTFTNDKLATTTK